MLWKFQSSRLCLSSASSGQKTMGGKALVRSYPSRFTAAISRRPRRTWKRHCGHTSKLFSATAKWQLEHSSVKSSAQDVHSRAIWARNSWSCRRYFQTQKRQRTCSRKLGLPESDTNEGRKNE